MSLSPEFIAKARALAFYRKFKVRRARRDGETWCDSKGLSGWTKMGAGHFGEAWEHEDHPGYVVKISGRADATKALILEVQSLVKYATPERIAPQEVFQHADQLDALAKSYGYKIVRAGSKCIVAKA